MIFFSNFLKINVQARAKSENKVYKGFLQWHQQLLLGGNFTTKTSFVRSREENKFLCNLVVYFKQNRTYTLNAKWWHFLNCSELTFTLSKQRVLTYDYVVRINLSKIIMVWSITNYYHIYSVFTMYL